MSSNEISENLSVRIDPQRNLKSEEEISLTSDTLGVIGTSLKGPAFVPHTCVRYEKSNEILNTFGNVFGTYRETENPDISPLTVGEWFNQGGEQLTFTRVLGAGKTGIPNEDGIVEGSGFIVGGNVVSGSAEPGFAGANSFATTGGDVGKTYFIGATFNKNQYETSGNSKKLSTFNDYLEQIGVQTNSVRMITDVILCPSGTQLFMSNQGLVNNDLDDISRRLPGTNFSDNRVVDSGDITIQNPYLFIKGLIDKDYNQLNNYKDNLFEVSRSTYSEKSLNDKQKHILSKGHLRYASFYPEKLNKHYKINPDGEDTFFIAHSNTSKFKDFQSSFKTASTPWIVSQPLNRPSDDFGSENKKRSNLHNHCLKLFKFHAIDDGEVGNRFRIRITPRKLGDFNNRDYSVFDVKISEYNLKTNSFENEETYKDLNLNPDSELYIARVFCTERTYYDFSKKEVIKEGAYRQTNNKLRVEINEDIEYKNIESYTLMPSGFMPYPRLNINPNDLSINNIKQKPVDYTWNILGKSRFENAAFERVISFEEDKYWGVLFDKIKEKEHTTIIKNNLYKFKLTVKSDSETQLYNSYYPYTKYFQDNYISNINNAWIRDLEDSDIDTTNSFFHLEKIMYIPDAINALNWSFSMYRRDGKDINSIGSLDDDLKSHYKYVNIDDLLKSDNENDSVHSKYLSFDFFTCGGFDGVNILDNDKRLMNQTALVKELENENKDNLIEGPTYFAYKEAHDIMTNDANCEFDILNIPAIGHHYINKKISIEANENRRYLTVLNVPEYSNYFKVDNNNIATKTGIIKDYNHLFIDPKIQNDSRFKEKEDIPFYLSTGTVTALNDVTQNYYNNRYTLNVLNTSKGNVDFEAGEDITFEDEETRFVVMPSFVAIKSLAGGVSKFPLDSLVVQDSDISISKVFNKTFIDADNNSFNNMINLSINSNANVNFVIPSARTDSEGVLKLNSANTSILPRNSLSRFAHNTRIMIDIKKKIKYLLLTSDIMFANNYALDNIQTSLSTALNNLLQGYVSRNVIKSFYVKLNTGQTQAEKEDALDNILRSKIVLSLFGAPGENVETMQLNDILNTTQNNLTETAKLDILLPVI